MTVWKDLKAWEGFQDLLDSLLLSPLWIEESLESLELWEKWEGQDILDKKESLEIMEEVETLYFNCFLRISFKFFHFKRWSARFKRISWIIRRERKSGR
jgi:hypothetical protein